MDQNVENKNIWANADRMTIILFLLLVFIGWINIYAAVFNDHHQNILDFSQRYGKQAMWILAACVMAMAIFIIDIKFFSFFSYVIYGISVFLLMAVLVLGTKVNGARSWFGLGGFQFQPSEFAKVGTCLALSKYLSKFNVKLDNFKSLYIPFAIILTPAFLILLQPDTGSALVFLIFSLVLYREGMNGSFLLLGLMIVTLFIFSLVAEKLFIILVLIGIAALVFFIISPKKKWTFNALVIGSGIFGILWGVDWFFSLNIDTYFIVLIALGFSSIWYLILALKDKIPNAVLILSVLLGSIAFTYSVDFVFNNILEEHQRQRVNILLGRETDPQGVGYNVNQSQIAIGSGGLLGKGFLKGTQTKYNFVPEQSTDFIFCTVGEEWGFVGTFVVISLFLALLLRIIYLAERQRSTFSRTYGYGLAAVLFFHLIVNVGMTIGIMPVIGIPLPFFSYGGSSLWSFTIFLFIFIRMDASRFDLLM